MKKSSFQYGMIFSIENEIFIPGPSLAAEKQGLGLKFSIENENFKPRMKMSSENENRNSPDRGQSRKIRKNRHKILPKSWFSKRIFGHPAGSSKLDRPHCKQFQENFVRGGMVFSCVRARMNFFDPRALWECFSSQCALHGLRPLERSSNLHM